LLEKTTKRNLQLDGLYNPDSLCFVLSQTDQAFNVMDYIKQTPVLDESTAADISQIQTFNGKISELKREKDKTKNKDAQNKQRAKNLSKDIADINSQLAKLSNGSDNLSQNRKRVVNDRETGQYTIRLLALPSNSNISQNPRP
jgi:septal ring factor EnvC (AmiA/AmiB activator)